MPTCPLQPARLIKGEQTDNDSWGLKHGHARMIRSLGMHHGARVARPCPRGHETGPGARAGFLRPSPSRSPNRTKGLCQQRLRAPVITQRRSFLGAERSANWFDAPPFLPLPRSTESSDRESFSSLFTSSPSSLLSGYNVAPREAERRSPAPTKPPRRERTETTRSEGKKQAEKGRNPVRKRKGACR